MTQQQRVNAQHYLDEAERFTNAPGSNGCPLSTSDEMLIEALRNLRLAFEELLNAIN